MRVKAIKLFNFRNYSSLNIDFATNFNIIYGDNAQGKTNILEAIFLCASGRSHRTSKSVDMVKMGNNIFYIKLHISRDESDCIIEISFDNQEKRIIKINEIPIKKIGNLMGQFNAVLFSPEDLLIIKEGPSERRRFVDITLSQLRPAYFYDLQQYSKILTQRNSLLKEIQVKKSLLDTIEVWNKKLAEVGAKIIKSRYDFTIELSKIAKQRHSNLTDGMENLDFKYVPAISIERNNDVKEIENNFIKILEQSLTREIIRGTTITGPQRDDYEFYLNDCNIKLYGSQGQQRTAILSLKLSEIEIMKAYTGEFPVLLLDDVMSELDIKRQQYLLNELKDIQTFVTCTDKDFFENKLKGEISYFNISRGEIKYVL